MEINKSKVRIVGGMGYIGRRIVKASLEQGHGTYVLQRRELGMYDIEKVQMQLSFKRLGARLMEASFSDHQSLVEAMRLADVVVCAMSGVPFTSHNILLQLKLVDAIKDAGNVKLFSHLRLDYTGQIGVGHYYHIFYEGSLTNFEIGAGGEEASELYPEVLYTRMDDYMKQYL